MTGTEQAGHDTTWDIHYHDGKSMTQTRVYAHCRDCAWRRFEGQNRGCRISVVVPAQGSAPDQTVLPQRKEAK